MQNSKTVEVARADLANVLGFVESELTDYLDGSMGTEPSSLDDVYHAALGLAAIAGEHFPRREWNEYEAAFSQLNAARVSGISIHEALGKLQL